MRLAVAPQYNLLALVNRVQPLDSELGAARLHRASVRARLSKTFQISAIHAMGSHARGTAIRWYSDLDMMVVVRRDEVTWGGRMVSSNTMLQRVLEDLRERYPHTSVRRDLLAAAIDFGSTKQSLDVVPAVFTRFAGGRPAFLIPDGQGDWLETSPATHDLYFEKEQARCGGKLRRVSQLLKWWKHGRQQPLPIRSFYVDMMLAGRGTCVGVKTYGRCLADFFELLAMCECAGLQDPCGIAGRISATQTQAQHEALNRAVIYARDHARAAIVAEQRRDHEEANRQWNLVFNGTY